MSGAIAAFAATIAKSKNRNPKNSTIWRTELLTLRRSLIGNLSQKQIQGIGHVPFTNFIWSTLTRLPTMCTKTFIAGFPTFFGGKVWIVSRTISGLFLEGAVRRLRKNEDDKSGKSPKKSGRPRKTRGPKTDKKYKKEGQVQDGKRPPPG